mmetsp:Transcript_22484/g.47569  ORF Transcript_22484/g.47569 Transcript_22484/m.47569 type:complete len:231 (+) Transcript_22484:1178-1870(+)
MHRFGLLVLFVASQSHTVLPRGIRIGFRTVLEFFFDRVPVFSRTQNQGLLVILRGRFRLLRGSLRSQATNRTGTSQNGRWQFYGVCFVLRFGKIQQLDGRCVILDGSGGIFQGHFAIPANAIQSRAFVGRLSLKGLNGFVQQRQRGLRIALGAVEGGKGLLQRQDLVLCRRPGSFGCKRWRHKEFSHRLSLSGCPVVDVLRRSSSTTTTTSDCDCLLSVVVLVLFENHLL